jgi:hypothetical protein
MVVATLRSRCAAIFLFRSHENVLYKYLGGVRTGPARAFAIDCVSF